MSFQDQKLQCADCSNEFVFTAGEQEFYQQRGFTNTPKRCEDCRSKKKAEAKGNSANRGGGGGGGGKRNFNPGGPRRHSGPPREERPKFPATCMRCGANFDAPFQPKEGRPVFCRECFQSSKGGSGKIRAFRNE